MHCYDAMQHRRHDLFGLNNDPAFWELGSLSKMYRIAKIWILGRWMQVVKADMVV